MTVQTETMPERSDAASVSASPWARILVVEDDVVTRKILEKRLSKNGYTIESAEDGAAGLELARQFKPDIILSDWMMPKMDGPELCAHIKSDPAFEASYFILLTAKDGNDDKVTALDIGADEYLVKPCEPAELLARVRAAERVVGLQKKLGQKNDELEAAMTRINSELEVTSQIQRDMLPQELLKVPGYDFAAYYRPSTECSGDYYDLFPLPDNRFAVLMADVSGHGTPAMVAMALTRSLMRLIGPDASSPGECLGEINRLLFTHLPTRQFVTAFLGICDPATGVIQYASAGHNPPLWIRRSERSAEYLENCEGFPLKLVTIDAEYDDHEMQLAPGDALLLYTDGIPEGANAESEQFENERLSDSAMAAVDDSGEKIIASIMDHLLSFTVGVPLADDVSMLLISRDAS